MIAVFVTLPPSGKPCYAPCSPLNEYAAPICSYGHWKDSAVRLSGCVIALVFAAKIKESGLTDVLCQWCASVLLTHHSSCCHHFSWNPSATPFSLNSFSVIPPPHQQIVWDKCTWGYSFGAFPPHPTIDVVIAQRRFNFWGVREGTLVKQRVMYLCHHQLAGNACLLLVVIVTLLFFTYPLPWYILTQHNPYLCFDPK